MSDRSVSPLEAGNESERGDEGRVSDGNGGAFDRMLEPFDQDKEEKEWELAFGQGAQEGERAKVVRSGYSPTQKEVEEHLVNHLPFRAWCQHCVKGKAKGMPHRVRKDKGEEQVPLVSVDYMFMEEKQKEGY